MIYIIDKDSLRIKEIVQEVSYSIAETTELDGKTSVNLPTSHRGVRGDFVYIKDENFFGVLDLTESTKDVSSTTMTVLQKETIFDRKVFLTNANLISSTGIEDFIVRTIRDNFTHSTDTLLNYRNTTPVADTHTKYNSKPSADDDGIYNFKTYLGNIMELYGIVLDFVFTDGMLTIRVKKSLSDNLVVDATVQDIVEYEEAFDVDVTAKVTVLATDTGNKATYYLLANRTTTTDANNPNRASGKVEIATCQTNEEMTQTALDVFKGNSYNHNVSFSIRSDSKLYESFHFVIGRPMRIKTQKNGIYDTFIKEIGKQSDSQLLTITCGNLPVKMTDKLKRNGVMK